jgi:ParB-like chromosome segregation protein Spo0J
MHIETVALADLHPPPRNVRMHPEAQIVELMRAVTMFGQTRPVVIDEDNTVWAGNGLITALTRLGRTDAQALRMHGLSNAAKT